MRYLPYWRLVYECPCSPGKILCCRTLAATEAEAKQNIQEFEAFQHGKSASLTFLSVTEGVNG